MFSQWLVVIVRATILTVVGRGGGCDFFDGGWVVVLVTKGIHFVCV